MSMGPALFWISNSDPPLKSMPKLSPLVEISATAIKAAAHEMVMQ